VNHSHSSKIAKPYLGLWEHNIDDSNRIMLPASWRAGGRSKEFSVLLSPDNNYLIVFSDEAFGDYLEELCGQVADETQKSYVERLASSLARRVSLDRVGRLPLPRELTSQAKITGRGELLGRRSRFEVWPVGGTKQALENNPEATAFLNKKLRLL
jgi:division/cell wall cluster transcriptional repressor MraZ